MSDESNELEKRFKNYDPGQHFTIVSQKLAQDKRLSWGARGLFVYLASNRHDYTFHESVIFKHASNGRRSTRRALHELIHYGYLAREQHINKKTRRFGQTTWSLYYVPNDRHNGNYKCSKKRADGNASNGHASNGKAHNGNSTDGNRLSNKYQVNKNQPNKNQGNKNQVNNSLDERKPADARTEKLLNKFQSMFHEQPTSTLKKLISKDLKHASDNKIPVQFDRAVEDIDKAMSKAQVGCAYKENPYKLSSYVENCIKNVVPSEPFSQYVIRHTPYDSGEIDLECHYISEMINNVVNTKISSDEIKDWIKNYGNTPVTDAVIYLNQYDHSRLEDNPVKAVKTLLSDWAN